MRVVLRRAANVCAVAPTDKRIHALLKPVLSYDTVIFHRGREAALRRAHNLSTREERTYEIFDYDHRDRICFPFGLAEKVYDALTNAGYEVSLEWASEENARHAVGRDESVYAPDWERLQAVLDNGFKFRWRQEECLRVLAANENGRIDAPPGFGKGEIIMLYCQLYPHAKIGVVVDSVAVLTTRLYPLLRSNLPSVGIVGGGKKVLGRRVMCYTADSLHHADPYTDIILCDEVHQAASDIYSASLGRFRNARMFGFSATHDKRLDNKDLRCEALFGPIRFHMGYQEAVEHGLVLPIEVIWSNVVADHNPCDGLKDVEKKRAGFWAHERRNKIIAANAAIYGDDAQVLIPVETIEHALYLHKLTGIEMVYAGDRLTADDIRRFDELELINKSFRPMTDERRAKLTKWFKRGDLRKAIATTVWNFGVDFRHLNVVIRADGGASPINDTQIPGRNSRHAIVGEKFVGILHDCLDQFDWGYNQRAKGRCGNYAEQGWVQHYPTRVKDREKLVRRLLTEGPTLTKGNTL